MINLRYTIHYHSFGSILLPVNYYIQNKYTYQFSIFVATIVDPSFLT